MVTKEAVEDANFKPNVTSPASSSNTPTTAPNDELHSRLELHRSSKLLKATTVEARQKFVTNAWIDAEQERDDYDSAYLIEEYFKSRRNSAGREEKGKLDDQKSRAVSADVIDLSDNNPRVNNSNENRSTNNNNHNSSENDNTIHKSENDKISKDNGSTEKSSKANTYNNKISNDNIHNGDISKDNTPTNDSSKDSTSINNSTNNGDVVQKNYVGCEHARQSLANDRGRLAEDRGTGEGGGCGGGTTTSCRRRRVATTSGEDLEPVFPTDENGENILDQRLPYEDYDLDETSDDIADQSSVSYEDDPDEMHCIEISVGVLSVVLLILLFKLIFVINEVYRLICLLF